MISEKPTNPGSNNDLLKQEEISSSRIFQEIHEWQDLIA